MLCVSCSPDELFPCCSARPCSILFFFFFNDTATTEIYTLSLHDALPIFGSPLRRDIVRSRSSCSLLPNSSHALRSEEHTSELQSQSNLVCRLLLEKKKKTHPRLDLYQTSATTSALIPSLPTSTLPSCTTH